MQNQTKMRPYRGQLFFMRYQRFHIFFTIFIDLFVGMKSQDALSEYYK